MVRLISTLALSLHLLTACGENMVRSGLEGVQVDQAAESKQVTEHRNWELIIHYASENGLSNDNSDPYTANWKAVKALYQSKLGSGDALRDEALNFYIKKMDDDEKYNSAALTANADQLKQVLCNVSTDARLSKESTPNEKSALLVIHNRHFKTRKIEYCEPGKALQTYELTDRDLSALYASSPELSADPFYRANPLSHEKVLNWALDFTETMKNKEGRVVFPADQYSRAFISGVHGGGLFAIAPLFVPNLAKVPDTELFITQLTADFAKNKPEINAHDGVSGDVISTSAVRKGQGGRGLPNKKGARGGNQNGARGGAGRSGGKAADYDLILGPLRYAFDPYGITKEAYANALIRKKNTQFSMVFLESCDSAFSEELLKTLRENAANVGTIFYSDKAGLDWFTIPDYKALTSSYDLSYGYMSTKIEQKLIDLANNPSAR